MTIERVCNQTEREILAPHVERFHEAVRILDLAARAFEPDEGLVFDPSRYVWLRKPEAEAT